LDKKIKVPLRHLSIVDAHVILRRDGKILLLRRAGDVYASGQLCLLSRHHEDGEWLARPRSGEPVNREPGKHSELLRGSPDVVPCCAA